MRKAVFLTVFSFLKFKVQLSNNGEHAEINIKCNIQQLYFLKFIWLINGQMVNKVAGFGVIYLGFP